MSRLFLPALLLFLLVACTGTQSPQPPRLLFVTHGDSASGPFYAVLIEDDLAGDAGRFTYLSDTETVLPGEPVAMDVVDRAGSRREAVLLLETAANSYSAAWFDLAQIDPDAATALTPDVVVLDTLLAGELADPGDLCLQDLQVSYSGGIIALLNVPAECGGSLEAPSIFVVDISDGSVFSLATSIDLLPSGLYIEQGNQFEPDELYFLDGATGSARLIGVTLPDAQSVREQVFSDGSDSPVPLQVTYSAGAFIALQPGRLNLVTDSPSQVTLQPATATRVIPDPYGEDLVALLVLHASSSSRLFVHRTPTDSDPVEIRLNANITQGTVDPAQMWAYFLRPGGLSVVDLIDVLEESSEAARASSHSVAEVGRPGFITWVEGVLPVP